MLVCGFEIALYMQRSCFIGQVFCLALSAGQGCNVNLLYIGKSLSLPQYYYYAIALVRDYIDLKGTRL